MKTFYTFLVCSALMLFITFESVNAQWAVNGTHIYNTNTANVGISNGALWAPSEKLHINTLLTGPASVMAERNYAGAPLSPIGYYRIKNTATGDIFNISLRKNGAVHEMLQSCFDAGTATWREYAYFNYTTHKYEMRSGIGVAEFLNTGDFLISSTGNTGIGTTTPLEKLEVSGAVKLGTTASTNTGTVRWNGTHFQGYNGSAWLDLDLQSKIRAFHAGTVFQMIPASMWVPVDYTMDSPVPFGWDQLGEFTTSPSPADPVLPETAYFTASESGFYQVNARAAFQADPGVITPTTFVSIAIFIGTGPGATTSHAVGNNLQIGSPAGPLTNNCAPNVSDVVYLNAGQIISIWVFHNAAGPLFLQPGPDLLYVSIHRVS